VKEFLSHAAVEFTAHNVDEDEAAYDALIALGLRTIPVTVIGDRIVRGFDPAALESAVDAWRASPGPPAR
jgi:glutaredoxin